MIDARYLLKRSNKNFPRLESGIDFTHVSEDEKKAIIRRIRNSYYRWYYQENKIRALKYAREYRIRRKHGSGRRGPQPKAATKFPMKRPARDIAFTHKMIIETPPEKLSAIINHILDPSSECIFAGLR